MAMDNTLEQLAQYIMQQLRLGMSEPDVRLALMQNGWAQPAIDGAFGIVHHYEAHPRLPQPLYDQAAQTAPAQPVTLSHAAALPASGPMVPVQSPAPTTSAATAGKKGLSQKKLIRLVLAFVVLVAIVFVAVIIWLSGDSISKFVSHIVSSSHSQTQSQQKNSASKKSAQQSKGTQTKPIPVSNDAARKNELNTLLTSFSDYYVLHQAYPTTAQLNDPSVAFLPGRPSLRDIADPKWSAADKTCVGTDSKAIFAAIPTPRCFAYTAVAEDGGICDGAATTCTRMTLTATLDNGQPYAISLDQNHAVD